MKYVIKYSPENTKEPVLADAILSTKVKVNILTARLDSEEGVMILEVLGDSKDARKIVSHLRKHGLLVEKLDGNVLKDDDCCVDCGLCVGVCPTDAIIMHDKLMELDNRKCILCRACVEVCPVKALSIREGI
ncbi:MAG: 4Fe-4S binding protein [Candidatus Altiarchaeota archaeon]